MTKEQIKNLIDTKVKGQGTAVDAGGALATILEGIIDLAAESEPNIIHGDQAPRGEDGTYYINPVALGITPKVGDIIKDQDAYYTMVYYTPYPKEGAELGWGILAVEGSPHECYMNYVYFTESM